MFSRNAKKYEKKDEKEAEPTTAPGGKEDHGSKRPRSNGSNDAKPAAKTQEKKPKKAKK